MKVMRLSEDEAVELFQTIRFAGNGGKPFCPRCGSLSIYNFKTRRIFKCKDCDSQFSLTSGTVFASRKLSIRDILASIALFVNSAKGHSALQASRELGVQYKTAWVMAHKLREALGVSGDKTPLQGKVEIDGAYFGGYLKPKNHVPVRVDRRRREYKTGLRQTVVVARERKGRTRTLIAKSESAAVNPLIDMIDPTATVYADEHRAYQKLHGFFKMERINHSTQFANGSTSTNQAESFFSRIRRAEIGIHHRIAGKYLGAYAEEMAWRENNRRRPNGEQFTMLASAVATQPISRQWKGYWQRLTATENNA